MHTWLKEALANKAPFTLEMRSRFFERVHSRVDNLLTNTNRLAVANAFINNRFREEFLERFPFAEFVIVQVARNIRSERIYGRLNHVIPPELTVKMGDQFEDITIPHTVIRNDVSANELDSQLKKLVLKSLF